MKRAPVPSHQQAAAADLSAGCSAYEKRYLAPPDLAAMPDGAIPPRLDDAAALASAWTFRVWESVEGAAPLDVTTAISFFPG